jgi:aryl-alcohol dehydrogenase-like predicted oxidoreductase
MQYTRLGNTGPGVSRICLGCMPYGVAGRGAHPWTLDEAASRPLIGQAESGINLLDTANAYSDGTSEEIVGRAETRTRRYRDGGDGSAIPAARRRGPRLTCRR